MVHVLLFLHVYRRVIFGKNMCYIWSKTTLFFFKIWIADLSFWLYDLCVVIFACLPPCYFWEKYVLYMIEKCFDIVDCDLEPAIAWRRGVCIECGHVSEVEVNEWPRARWSVCSTTTIRFSSVNGRNQFLSAEVNFIPRCTLNVHQILDSTGGRNTHRSGRLRVASMERAAPDADAVPLPPVSWLVEYCDICRNVEIVLDNGRAKMKIMLCTCQDFAETISTTLCQCEKCTDDW